MAITENREAKKATIIRHLARHGRVNKACEHAGTLRRNYYIWLESDENFRRDVESALEEFEESCLELE